MTALEVLLILGGVAGHTTLWVAVLNRLHGTAMPRWAIDWFSLNILFLIVAMPVLLAIEYGTGGWATAPLSPRRQAIWVALTVFTLLTLFAWGRWLKQQLKRRKPKSLQTKSSQAKPIQRPASELFAPGLPTLIGKLPGNEVTQLQVREMSLGLESLPRELAGLRIAQLSDLHMSGRVLPPFYEQVIDETLALDADMILVTGDLFDAPQCLDWIDTTLGRLKAPLGVYFILGNHDEQVDHRRAIKLLERCGLIYVGGRWIPLEVRETTILLAGNELPWFPPAADMSTVPADLQARSPFSIALCHCPDQFGWAEAMRFDLALAGHTHGGQVRFPLIGSVLCPSWYGTQWDEGIFEGTPTIMHVTRGVSGLTPLRWNCPPEIVALTLQTA